MFLPSELYRKIVVQTFMAFGIDRETHRPIIGQLLSVIDLDFLGFKSDLYTGKNIIHKKASKDTKNEPLKVEEKEPEPIDPFLAALNF